MYSSMTAIRPQAATRVLVADDQPDVLEALRWLLTGEGYEPEFVSSTEGVLERLRERPFDLLLMDLNYSRDTTSGREGLELIPQVRAHDPSLPIVVMTGWGSVDTAVEAMRLGAKSFVQKPWEDVTLLEIVQREIEEAQASKRRDAKQQREFEDARLIQRGLLPAAMPQTAGVQLAASWQPANGVGGDCFDALTFTNGGVGLTIADVAGKGVPAALLMSNLQAAVRAFAQEGTAPGSVCTSVNRLLCRNIASGKFVTFCYAVVDTVAHVVTYANAGHNPPVLMHANGRIDRLSPTGLVLGVAHDWTYSTGSVETEPGDRLVWFTDGITEALAPDGEEFGDDRIIEILQQHRAAPADALVRTLSDAVSAWTETGPQDDATLIVAAV